MNNIHTCFHAWTIAGRIRWLTLGKGTRIGGMGRRLTSYSLSLNIITYHFYHMSAFLSRWKKKMWENSDGCLRTYPLELKTPFCGWMAGQAGSWHWAGAQATARWQTWRSAASQWLAWTGGGGLWLSGEQLGRHQSNAFQLAGSPRGPAQVYCPWADFQRHPTERTHIVPNWQRQGCREFFRLGPSGRKA